MPRINVPGTILSVLALIALSPAVSTAQTVPPSPIPPPVALPIRDSHVIVVTGQGSVDAIPDQATVALGVQVTRPTAQEAQEQSSAIMEQIVRQVQALGIPSEKVRTTTVSLFPQRRPGPGIGEVTGYLAINRITVTVDDLRLTGRVVDAGVAAGANTVDSLTFGLRDPAPYRTRALRLAVQNARAAAEAIASASGIANLRVLRIEEVGPVVLPRIGIAAPAAVALVMPGTLSIMVQVRVVYGFQ